MISNHSDFIQAIHDKKLVRVEFYSKPDQGVIDRECAPLDYGPEPGVSDGTNRYWIWDYTIAKELNPLGLCSDQIVKVHVMGKGFDVEASGFAARSWSTPRVW